MKQSGAAYVEAEFKDLDWVRRVLGLYNGTEAVHRVEHDIYRGRLVLVACKHAGEFDGSLGSAIVCLSNAKFKIVA